MLDLLLDRARSLAMTDKIQPGFAAILYVLVCLALVIIVHFIELVVFM